MDDRVTSWPRWWTWLGLCDAALLLSLVETGQIYLRSTIGGPPVHWLPAVGNALPFWLMQDEASPDRGCRDTSNQQREDPGHQDRDGSHEQQQGEPGGTMRHEELAVAAEHVVEGLRDDEGPQSEEVHGAVRRG